MVIATGGGGEDEEGLTLVLGEQDLAPKLDGSQFGVHDRLGVIAASGDVVAAPDPLKLCAVLTELRDDGGGAAVRSAPCRRDPQVTWMLVCRS